MRLRAVVVVPARDEEVRIGACLRALGRQTGFGPEAMEVVLVLDGCTDATAERAAAAAGAAGVVLRVVEGPGAGVGPARSLGMAAARARLAAAGSGPGGVIASTDADTRCDPGWLAGLVAACDAGAAAAGGRIELDPAEAALLPAAVRDARVHEAAVRLAAVRLHTPDAEHHQFSGAALALTAAAYDAVGGLPPVRALEDEALERVLRRAGLPIAYVAAARVVTSARTGGRVERGLAQVLRAGAWRAAHGGAAGDAAPSATSGLVGGAALTGGAPAGDAGRVPDAEAVTVVRPAGPLRGSAVRVALAGAAEIVVVLGPHVAQAAATALAAPLLRDASVHHVRAGLDDEPGLTALTVRPALNLHAPDLALVRAPLGRSWAVRRSTLAGLSLPHGQAVDLTVLVDVWRTHGLGAIAEVAVDAPATVLEQDPGVAAYELLAALSLRLGDPPALSSAVAGPDGTRRALLDEHAPAVTTTLPA